MVRRNRPRPRPQAIIRRQHRWEKPVARDRLPKALKALLAAHPYEEPAFDVYPLLNEGAPSGLGRLGRLPEPVRLDDFASCVRAAIDSPQLRYVGAPDTLVRTVALCTGSGASLLRKAARSGADVLLTGDVKYHDARDAEDLGIALIDAGHFPTEIMMAESVAGRLRRMLGESGHDAVPVFASRYEHDPFRS